MKAEKNAQAAQDGHDARNRNQNTGNRDALRGRIRDLLMGKVAEAASDKNQRMARTQNAERSVKPCATLSPWDVSFRGNFEVASARSDRYGRFDPLDCGGFSCYGQIRFGLIFRVYESDVGQADKTEDVAQVRFLKIELCIWRAGRIGAATRSEHISFLARQESFWSGFSVRKRLAKTHNLVQPSLEPRGDRKVVHRVANYDDVSRLKFFDQFVRILERRTVCRRVLFRV